MTQRPIIVVEDDPFPRLLQAFLDEHPDPARDAAIQDLGAHDIADYPAWLKSARQSAPGLYPAIVRRANSQEELLAALPGAHAVVTESLLIGKAELAVADSLRVVQKFGTVMRNIDEVACRERGIPVLTLRRRANMGCAEYAMGLMIMLAKKIHITRNRLSLDQLREAGFKPKLFDKRYTSNSNWARVPSMCNLHGSNLGIVGFGEIGREMALRANAFGMNVHYTQRTRMSVEEEKHWSVQYQGFEALLAQSDWLCLAVPLNDQTRHLMNTRTLALMKPGARLINISRADVVERHALLEALSSGHLGGLGLDTFYEEPKEGEDPLTAFDQVIITQRLAAQPRFNAFTDLTQMMSNLAKALK